MHSFLEKVYEALFTLFTSTKRTLPLNWFVIKWTENSKTLFAEIRSDGLKKILPLWIRVSLILLASLHARAFARRRKAWFYLRMSRILVTAKHRWTTLRMSRPLFVGSYLQVTWWALGVWKRTKICMEYSSVLIVVAGTVDAFTALECEVVYQPAFSAPQETDFLLHVTGGSDLKLKCVAKVRTVTLKV